MQIVRRYEPDMEAQVGALLLLLRSGVRPDGGAPRPARESDSAALPPAPHPSDRTTGAGHVRQ